MAERSAVSLINRARAGDEAAQLALGRLYLDGGSGLAVDPAAAFVWLEKAAQRDSAEALTLLGERVPAAAVAEPGPAAPVFERAAAADCAGAMKVLAYWALSGATAGISVERAFVLLDAAARKGNVGAQLQLAWCLERGEGCSPDRDAALHWFEKAAHQGSYAAKEILADHYWRLGREEARGLLEECARHGSTAAGERLGLLLIREERSAEAVPWLMPAACAGGVDAQLALGRLYATKGGRGVTGVPHRYKNAIAWFERAAREGSAEAWFELSRLYSLRSCSLRDPWTARQCLERAAELGHTEAQYRCGKARLRRSLREDNEIAAAAWLLRAAAAGHAEALRLVREHWPSAEAPSGDLVKCRAAAIAAIARVDLDLARRLEMGEALRLCADAALRVDPYVADRGHCLVLPVARGRRRTGPRLVLIDTAEKRATLDRAKHSLDSDGPDSDRLARTRIRRVIGLLQTEGFPREVFDWVHQGRPSAMRRDARRARTG